MTKTKMGLKKFFKIKPPEEQAVEKNRAELMELGIPTKNPNKKIRDKFAAYGQYARDKSKNKMYAPPGYEQYASGQSDDLNKSEVDDSPQNQGSSASTADLNRGPDNAADPYAVKAGNGLDSDPFSSVSAGAVGIGSRSFASAYDGMTSYSPRSRTGNIGAGAGASNSNSRNSPYNDIPAVTNVGNREKGSSLTDNNRPNPFGRRRGGVKSSSTSTLNTASNASSSANPYSSMGTDEYSDGMKQFPDLDLDLNEGPRSGELDSNQVAIDEDLNEPVRDSADDLNNAPASQEQQLLPKPGPQQQEKQIEKPVPQQQEPTYASTSFTDYDPTPQWQFEEEEQQQQEQTGRGYKTFEELQKEEEAKQQQEEDEAVDEIKQEIRFTKQGSVQSTRNTLRMAQEAEMSGMNTVGLLGHQSHQFGNVENNLDLMHSQNRIADEKINELKSLNRSLFAVHVSNPFNSKRRAREKAETLKNRKIEDKLLQEEKLQNVQDSTKRMEGVMNQDSGPITTRGRYHREDVLKRAQKYRFEADEEDDMMEIEIDRNLDQIGQISGRLKKLALAAGSELDSQKGRLANIEDNADDMDIRLAMNTQRMAGIR